jgi:signal transduction histidine kinase
MYSEMLAKDVVRDEEKRREYLRTLQGESDRLAHLVENVLAYARIEDGRHQPRRQEIRAEELLERVLPALLPRCEEADVRLETRPGASGETRLHTDADAVEQILFNLVDNACKYGRSPTDPRILIESDLEGERFALRVRDNGEGIPASKRRAIFSAFDRGARDPSDENPGVGLGLALARALARDLGGELVLEDGGSGACFRLELPTA